VAHHFKQEQSLMGDLWLRRLAWFLALTGLAVLAIAAILLLQLPALFNTNWWESQVKAFATLGAPILGLVIVLRQPRNRIGWLWLAYASFTAIRALSLAYFFINHSRFSGYSSLGYFLLWLSEPANLATILCTILLILWFPDGQLPSRRWRFLHGWMLVASLLLAQRLFVAGAQWNGPDAGGIHIENSFGWIPDNALNGILTTLGFFSLVLISILAAVALLLRYRSAKSLVRLQIRWFVFGGFMYVILDFLPVFFIRDPNSNFQIALSAVGFAAIIPLYVAAGIAVLRYRLYDIDVIIRRTLQYTLLTGLLALVFFGVVILLQSIFGVFTGQADSPLVTVISTLIIAALFNPLRHRIQDFIDQRFYRKKYDAERMLQAFSQSVRNETDLDTLTAELAQLAQETMQPSLVSVWIKDTRGSGRQALTDEVVIPFG
jgi:hypothetical protein